MPLQPGTTLGPYQIDAPLGAGGMGEVYKATDTRLGRTVAIKVLPEHVASDPDLKQRFEREARTVAALNHPHICTLHDIGSQDGIDFLVMEYLDGETVAQRLEKGALPLDQALQIAIDIADALDKAHRQGIVHRDLKPANIMLTKAGAKLLDFGLAKLKPPEQAGGLSALPTQPADLTQQGAILGTFQYMAPEQLEGQEADARTDIFAFGTVVYEMVTGKKAFEGKSQASVIGAILKDEPPAIATLVSICPPALDPVIKTCLAKDPEDRWQSVEDVGRQLGSLAGASPPSPAVTPLAVVPGSPGRQTLALVAASVIAAAVASLATWGLVRQGDVQTGLLRFTLAEPTIAISGTRDFALSANGSQIVYRDLRAEGNGYQLYLRALDQLEGVPLSGTENVSFDFEFSPNGEWVVFQREIGHAEKVSIFGGAPETIAHLPRAIQGKSWGPDDQIVFGTVAGGLVWASASSGDTEELTTLDTARGETAHMWPSIMASHQAVLFAAASARGLDGFQLAVVSLETRQVTPLGIAGTGPRSVETGHIVYAAQDRSLRAVPFDPERLVVVGSPVTLLENIMMTETGAANFSLSENGRLVYMAGSGSVGNELVWVDRTGQVIETVVEALSRVWPGLSPSRSRVAATVDDDIWVHDLRSDYTARLTDEGINLSPIWTPDGERVTFSSNSTGPFGVYSRPADLSGPAELLVQTGNTVIPGSWTPDGKTLVYYEVNPDTQRDIWIRQANGTLSPFLVTEFNEANPRLSPDGRWVAYASNRSGESRVYVRPFPGGDTVIPVSTGPGTQPVWSPNGQDLFYRNGDQMLVVAVDTGQDFRVGETEIVFEAPFVLDPANSGAPTYDVSLNGQQFLMVRRDGTGDNQLTVVLNWFEELKALVPTGR